MLYKLPASEVCRGLAASGKLSCLDKMWKHGQRYLQQMVNTEPLALAKITDVSEQVTCLIAFLSVQSVWAIKLGTRQAVQQNLKP